MAIPTYLTPGVYRTPQVTTKPELALVRTDIAGFVGFAERGPLPEDFSPVMFDATQVALKITSWREFQANFGGFMRSAYLAYGVRAFFENGGDTCYVVRVAATTAQDPADQPARAMFTLPAGAPTAIGILSQIISPFLCVFKPSGATLAATGDLVRIDSSGASQINHVAAVLDGGQILLATKLPASIQSNATVSRFPKSCTIAAASRGNWGNRIRLQINSLDAGAFALRATVDLGPEQFSTEMEFYRRLTITDPGDDNYAPAVLEQQSNLIRMEVPAGSGGGIDLAAADPSFAAGQVYLQGGRDGLAKVTLRDFAGSSDDLRGLRLLEEIEEIGILAAPDSVFPGTPPLRPASPTPDPCAPAPTPIQVTPVDDPTAEVTPLDARDSVQFQRSMIEQCNRLRYRVAVLDPPIRKQIGEMQLWPTQEGLLTRASKFAAIYYPWLKVPDPLEVEGLSRQVPPSGHVAGVYAHMDLTFGVQRPPANVALEFATDVVQPISDLQQEGLNANYVNALRAFPGRGIRVWGARSLASAEDSDWRFIHVRRLMSAIEATALRSSRWAVFQNNDRALRSSLQHSLQVLLQGIWAKGGLKGGKPADGFYVKCDSTNNPQVVIDKGQLICEVGVAIAAPMEFIVFEIRQDAAGAQVLEN